MPCIARPCFCYVLKIIILELLRCFYLMLWSLIVTVLCFDLLKLVDLTNLFSLSRHCLMGEKSDISNALWGGGVAECDNNR